MKEKIEEVCKEFNLRLHSIDDKYIRITNFISDKDFENIKKYANEHLFATEGKLDMILYNKRYRECYEFYLNEFIKYRLDINIKDKKFRVSTHYTNSKYTSFEDLKIINKIIDILKKEGYYE